MDELGEHRAKLITVLSNSVLRKLYDSVKATDCIQILLVVEKVAEVWKQIHQNILVDVFWSQQGLICSLFLFDDQLLDASGCIRLTNRTSAVQEVGEEAQECLGVFIWNLVAEHVDKLDASRFQDLKIVNFLLLKFRDDKLLDVHEQSVSCYVDLTCTIAVSVSADASCNQ